MGSRRMGPERSMPDFMKRALDEEAKAKEAAERAAEAKADQPEDEGFVETYLPEPEEESVTPDTPAQEAVPDSVRVEQKVESRFEAAAEGRSAMEELSPDDRQRYVAALRARVANQMASVSAARQKLYAIPRPAGEEGPPRQAEAVPYQLQERVTLTTSDGHALENMVYIGDNDRGEMRFVTPQQFDQLQTMHEGNFNSADEEVDVMRIPKVLAEKYVKKQTTQQPQEQSRAAA